MKNKKNSKKGSGFAGLPVVVILVGLTVSILAYIFIFGDPSNFQGNNPENQPIPGNYFGIIYKGGFIVPILMTLLLIVLTFSVERYFAIRKAKGKGSVVAFVKEIQKLLSEGNIRQAISMCDEQKGSVANVIVSGLKRYEQVEKETELAKDQKLVAIRKEIEEATALELPGLEQNLVFLSTIASLATLIGLLGTVLGMIRAFAALANAGAPDSVALAAGISEALINTALGIGSAALAIISYSYFTTQIDKLTYSIDEAGFSIEQTYAAKH
ncbi:MAG: MotA/TolQ/ExbB proton channel family protein [Mangrovibacterium sp.]